MPLSRYCNYSFSGAMPALTRGSVTLTPSLLTDASTQGGFAVLPTVAVAVQPVTPITRAIVPVNNTNFLIMLIIFYSLPWGIATTFFMFFAFFQFPYDFIEVVLKLLTKTAAWFVSFTGHYIILNSFNKIIIWSSKVHPPRHVLISSIR